jgi:Periplasmic component of the Tol biopolymer transport system
MTRMFAPLRFLALCCLAGSLLFAAGKDVCALEEAALPAVRESGAASAQAGAQTAWVTDPQLRMRIAIADPVGTSPHAARLQQTIQENLSFLPFAIVIDPRTVPGGVAQPAAIGPELDMRRYQLAGAQTLITSLWRQGGAPAVDIHAFDVTTGKYLFGTSYANIGEATVFGVADAFCAEFMKALTGKGEFFLSTLAFVKTAGPAKKDIWTVKPTGRNLGRITNIAGDSLSPAWSPDGQSIVFTNVDIRTHGLGLWEKSTGATRRVRFPGNTVIGPAFLPGRKILVSLSMGRNPGIFLLDEQLRRERAVENSASIDVSPSVDASGTYMAFVSSRMGNPHVFLKNLRSGGVTRVTYNGRYNTEPSISPDGTHIVFSRMESGGHRIFVYDVERRTETQITHGPGSDEQPAFAPDGYFVAFTSSRGGKKQIYLTTRNGGSPRLVPTGPGDAAFPAWGLTGR